jgi:CHAT domain-containing protein
LQIQKIPGAAEIQTQVVALADAVRTGRPEAVELGERLYRELFGQLGQAEAAKPSWLLSLEGTLFEAPFAALVTERKGGKVIYLVSKHSVQTIPGALLLSKRPEAGTGSFLGVGDPIYNAADPRWEGQRQSGRTNGPGAQFGRLVGSAEELRASATNWGGQPVVLLEGAAARRDMFLAKVATGPAVVHLATHVISRGTQALIAFGLGPNGESEFLTTTDVASLRVAGAVVAMTGCDTGYGVALAGAGLQGLTRAWQMAGASVVIATSWPVRDSTGDIFASFYRHLREVPAAEALRLSQMEMLESGTWRATPSYWAPYQVAGGAR